MAFFSSCWLMIELHLIPAGLAKWLYLSFYIHPLLLVPCQIFLWLQALIGFLSTVLFVFLDCINFLAIYICRCVKSAVVYCFPFIRVSGHSVHSAETFEVAENSDDYLAFRSFSFFCQAASTSPELKVFPPRIDCKEEDENEYGEAASSFDDVEPNPDLDIESRWSFPSASEEILLPNKIVNKEDGANLTSPVVVWSWPESLPRDADISYSMEEEESEIDLNEHIPSPYEDLTMADMGLDEPLERPEHDEQMVNVGLNPVPLLREEPDMTMNSDGREEDEAETDLNGYIPPPYEHVAVAELRMDEDLEWLEHDERMGNFSSNSDLLFGEEPNTRTDPNGLEWLEHDEQMVNLGSNTVLLVREEHNTRKESDPFYVKYTERMKWFDVLGFERTCGISVVLDNKFESETISNPISLGKTAKKRLLKSLESDLELACVAQTCLSWEVLHHQYRKVNEQLTSSCPRSRVSGYRKSAVEFQKFQVLIERFLEDERSTGKRYLQFIHGRFSQRSLLQVPELSGFYEEDEEPNGRINRAVLELKELARAIESCIRAFHTFVETDKNKSWWKFGNSLWSYPPVEDPRDLQLLHDLTKRHQQKVQLLKQLQGKRKLSIKRGGSVGRPTEEPQRKEILFTMIDLKLVTRVLQMATISSSQLEWCEAKVGNITFRDGKVTRSGECPLFPIS